MIFRIKDVFFFCNNNLTVRRIKIIVNSTANSQVIQSMPSLKVIIMAKIRLANNNLIITMLMLNIISQPTPPKNIGIVYLNNFIILSLDI